MDEAWYTAVADELAQCLTDARACAEACEALLERLAEGSDGALHRRVVDVVVAPAAVSRVLIDLIDQPKPLVAAAATLCRETASDAAGALSGVEGADETVRALRTCATSCAALLDAL
ncbi:MAG TPA: hypothetical protein VFA56_01010 [Gaiellaceae bacterium]|nr:hypothetical protein [Gaiellaceae bacterium]